MRGSVVVRTRVKAFCIFIRTCRFGEVCNDGMDGVWRFLAVSERTLWCLERRVLVLEQKATRYAVLTRGDEIPTLTL